MEHCSSEILIGVLFSKLMPLAQMGNGLSIARDLEGFAMLISSSDLCVNSVQYRVSLSAHTRLRHSASVHSSLFTSYSSVPSSLFSSSHSYSTSPNDFKFHTFHILSFIFQSHRTSKWLCVPLGFVAMHHLHTFHGDPELGTRPLKDRPDSLNKAIEALEKWYDSDKPFFTKKDLESVSNQLNRRYNTRRKKEQKQLISVKGLSGSKIYYEVMTGQVLEEAAKNEDWEMYVVC